MDSLPHTHISTHIHTYTHPSTHTHTYTHTHTHTHTYTHTHTHTHTSTHTHTHAPLQRELNAGRLNYEKWKPKMGEGKIFWTRCETAKSFQAKEGMEGEDIERGGGEGGRGIVLGVVQDLFKYMGTNWMG